MDTRNGMKRSCTHTDTEMHAHSHQRKRMCWMEACGQKHFTTAILSNHFSRFHIWHTRIVWASVWAYIQHQQVCESVCDCNYDCVNVSSATHSPTNAKYCIVVEFYVFQAPTNPPSNDFKRHWLLVAVSHRIHNKFHTHQLDWQTVYIYIYICVHMRSINTITVKSINVFASNNAPPFSTLYKRKSTLCVGSCCCFRWWYFMLWYMCI